jgi:magnesium chelatase family protein
VRPPYAAPHHDCSKASLVGGGSGRVRPGLLSLSHGGVVLLDEFPLFRTDVIDALRQPLESGEVTVARGDESVTLPARSIVVMASNPCPCGNRGLANGNCRCRPTELRDYERRVRGPLLDRIDITINLSQVTVGDAALAPLETSAEIRQRVISARERQADRYRGLDWRLNAHASGVMLRKQWPLPYEAQREIDLAIMSNHLSRRGAVRVHRLALTVADLEGADHPGLAEVQVALRLRRGDPLPESALSRRAG